MSSPPPAAPEPRASLLLEESRALLDARALLRDGDPDGALVLLDKAQTRFPTGTLTQEREALVIEALLGRGDRDAARARAQAFVKAYPTSPLAARVRTMAQ